MAVLISDIIQDYVIDKLNTTLSVSAVEAPTGFPGTQRVKFCENKWLKLYGFVTKDGDRIDVSTYDNDGYVNFTVTESTDEFTLLSSPTLNRPLLFNGTFKNTRFEWAKYSDDEKDKLPFIWIVSPTNETNGNANSSIGRTSDLKMWFVHWSDWSLLNADRQSEAVEPLFALVSEFIDTIDRMNFVFEGYDNYSTKDFPKFGTETPIGVDKTIFDSTLSAIEMDLVVRIFKRYCNLC